MSAKKIKFQIEQNIQNFKYRFHKLKDPLQKEYEYGEAWKKYLFHIFKLGNENIEIKTLNLARNIGLNTRNTRKNIQKLLAKGLISIKGENNNRRLVITEKGKKALKIR